MNEELSCHYNENYAIDGVSFVYGQYRIAIDKCNSAGERIPFHSSEDPEILQKLLNADTCMEAIEELMDPANGGYAS